MKWRAAVGTPPTQNDPVCSVFFLSERECVVFIGSFILTIHVYYFLFALKRAASCMEIKS